MGTAGTAFRIHLVTFARGSQHPPLMEIPRLDFRLQRVARILVAQEHARPRRLGIGVPRLNHEILNHPMEQHPVVIPFPDQLQHILPVYHGLVVKPQADIPQRGFHTEHRSPVPVTAAHHRGKRQHVNDFLHRMILLSVI